MGAGGLALTAVHISLAVPKAAHGVVAVFVPVTKATANPTIALDADHVTPSRIGAAQEANRGENEAPSTNRLVEAGRGGFGVGVRADI
jgi:hypothetical protein